MPTFDFGNTLRFSRLFAYSSFRSRSIVAHNCQTGSLPVFSAAFCIAPLRLPFFAEMDGRRMFQKRALRTRLPLCLHSRQIQKLLMDPTSEDTAVLAAILNTAVDAIVTIDERGTLLLVNQAFERLFGYNSSEAIGRNVSMLMPEPDRSAHDGYLHRYLQTGRTAIIGTGRQVLGQRKNGTLFPIDLAVSEIKIDGRVLFAGIMRDMTERKQSEAELRSTQQKLIQSERLAAIGQMVTGLAHESRNALQRSRACLDMLSLDLETLPVQQDLVRRSQVALVELQTLYEEVRNFAAPIQLERSRVNIQRLCNEVWGNLASQWRSKNIKLELKTSPCPEVLCDKHRIGQLLRNILDNAIYAGPNNSSIVVSCSAHEESRKGGPCVEVSVTDQGPGLDATQQQRIFEPFFTTKTKGTGLGMAICQRIIDAHDGSIFVASTDANVGSSSNHGAKIVFQLPITELTKS
jgi:two-component system sensor kinase FixL